MHSSVERRGSTVDHGVAVRVFSRTAGDWKSGRVAKPVVPGRVTVEFELDGNLARKHLDLGSPDLCVLSNELLEVDGECMDSESATSEEHDPEFSFFQRTSDLTAGENILGKAVEPSDYVADYEDVQDPKKRWKPTGKVVVPIEDRKVRYRHSSAKEIKLSKSVNVDEDFAGKGEELRLTSEDGREVFREGSCGATAELATSGISATLNAEVRRSLGDGEGHLNFSFSLPFIHLKVKEQARSSNRIHIAEVILGCVVQGRITSCNGKSEADARAYAGLRLCNNGVNVGIGCHQQKNEGLQHYDFDLKVHGGPSIKISQQRKTMNEMVGHLQTTWQEKARNMPQTWKVLWVRVRGTDTSSRNTIERLVRQPVAESESEPMVNQSHVIDAEQSPPSSHTNSVACVAGPAQDEILVLIYGDAGVGKSTLINEMVGQEFEVAKTGKKSRGVTKEISGYPSCYKGIDFILVDVPGIGDQDRKVTDVLDELSSLYDGVAFAALLILVDGSSPRFTLGAQLIPRLFDVVFKDSECHWCENTIVVGTKFDKVPDQEHDENMSEIRNIAAGISDIVNAERIPEGQIIPKGKAGAEGVLECLVQVVQKQSQPISFVRPDQCALFDAFLKIHAKDGSAGIDDLKRQFEEDWQRPRQLACLKRLEKAYENGHLHDLQRALENIEDIFLGSVSEDMHSKLHKYKAIAKDWENEVGAAIARLKLMYSNKDYTHLPNIEQKARDVPFRLHEEFQHWLRITQERRQSPEEVRCIDQSKPECVDCGRQFCDWNAYRSHRRHFQHMQYKCRYSAFSEFGTCPHCGKKFRSANAERDHMWKKHRIRVAL